MQKLPFQIGECVRICVCVHAWEGVPESSERNRLPSLEAVNNVVLKTCEVLPSGMI